MTVRFSALRTGPAVLPRNIISVSGTHFCYRLTKPQLNYLIEIRTRYLPACSIVPQSLLSCRTRIMISVVLE
jgi:hypothetical protein